MYQMQRNNVTVTPLSQIGPLRQIGVDCYGSLCDTGHAKEIYVIREHKNEML